MSSSSLGIDKLGFGLGRSSSDFSRDEFSGMSGFSSPMVTPSQSVSGYNTPQGGRRNGRSHPSSARADRYVDALAEVKAILNPQNVSLTEERLDYGVDLDWDALGDVSLEAVAQGDDDDLVVAEKPDSEAIGRKKRGLEQLRAQLEESDVALKQLEDYLAWFQKDLGSLSSDMEVLQGKSLAISERLNKRVDVEKILAPKIDAMIVPGHISQTIFEGDLDADWIKCVHEFEALQAEEERKVRDEERKKVEEKEKVEEKGKAEEKAEEKDAGEKDPEKDPEQKDPEQKDAENTPNIPALQESAFDKNDASVKPKIKIEISGPAGQPATVASPVVKLDPISKASQFQSRLLKDKIIERSRDYFVLKIKQIRLPGTNVQQIQREMKQNKDMYIYLERHYPELAVGLKKAYVNTIKWYYLSNFTRYIACLEKLNVKTVDKSILLGTDDGRGAASGGILGGIYGSSAAAPRDPSIATTQELINTTAKRIRQLEEEESTVMPAKIAENNPLHHWLETGFRSLMQALLDNCNVEYNLLEDLFGSRNIAAHSPQASPAKQTVSRIDKLFQKIFLPTFETVANYTNELTATTYDAFGLLICIRICQKMAGQSHGVPMLRAVYKRLAMQLWPRLQIILDANCESLRRAASKPSSFVSANNSANPNMAAFAPIQVTQEWANFEAAILTLSQRPKAVREPVAQCLGRLQNEFESFLTKVSGCLGSSKTKGIQERRETFLYNNYFLVSTIIGDIEGDLAQEQKTHLQQLLEAYKQS
ncbi:Vacuolar protein sorting-associated protein 52 [Yarrowia sp. E02]|nr:Vacuolar protein sorting-associated protein 52 [Yarrowia sp. E02]